MRVRQASAPAAANAIARLTRTRHSAVVFVGAGISARSGLPLARELKAEMFAQLARGILKSRTTVRQCQGRLDGVMLESLVEVIGRQAPGISRTFASVFRFGTPSEVHHALANQLATKKVAAIITTNFDNLLERAYESQRRNVPGARPLVVVRTRRDKWSDGRPLLLKLHGCVRKPHTIAITLNRVGKGLEAWKRTWLTKLAVRPFLVAGYSDLDKDISPVLAQLRNDWIWLLHFDRTVGEHVPVDSLLREMLTKPRRTVVRTDVSAAITVNYPHRPTVTSAAPASTWSTAVKRLIRPLSRPQRCIILGDILCELLGDDKAADRAYRQGLKEPGLSRTLYVDLSGRRVRLFGEKWDLEKGEYLHRKLVHSVGPLTALRPNDRATIERLHAVLLRKRATRLSQEAEDALRRAQTASASIKDRENVALAQMNRAVVLQKRGRYKVAEPLYEKALRAFRKQGNLASMAKTLLNYGSLLGMTGRNPLALKAYREGALAFEMIGDPLWAARLQVNMAIVLRELHQPKRALPLALAARDVIKRHGDKYWTFNAEQAVSNIRRDIRYGWHP